MLVKDLSHLPLCLCRRQPWFFSPTQAKTLGKAEYGRQCFAAPTLQKDNHCLKNQSFNDFSGNSSPLRLLELVLMLAEDLSRLPLCLCCRQPSSYKPESHQHATWLLKTFFVGSIWILLKLFVVSLLTVFLSVPVFASVSSLLLLFLF